IENFAILPSDVAEVLNGHVLFLYTAYDRVISCTFTAVNDVVPGDVSIYKYQVKKLCKSLEKFRSATPLTWDPAPSPNEHVKLSLRKGFSSPRRDRIRERLEFVAKVEKLQCSSSGPLQKEGKTFSPETRMFVHVAINNHVPTRNVPNLLGKFARDLALRWTLCATTQEGVHINSVHITSKNGCNVIVVNQLEGGTAEDYTLSLSHKL
ncbi:hypothetical protein LSH36_1743g00001, partial [Paralvinella palmiformis]